MQSGREANIYNLVLTTASQYHTLQWNVKCCSALTGNHRRKKAKIELICEDLSQGGDAWQWRLSYQHSCSPAARAAPRWGLWISLGILFGNISSPCSPSSHGHIPSPRRWHQQGSRPRACLDTTGDLQSLPGKKPSKIPELVQLSEPWRVHWGLSCALLKTCNAGDRCF